MKLWIGENIRQLRGELALTQEQLAGRLHCTAQAVSKWENGATAPDIAMLPLIAQALGTGLDALFAPCRTPYRHRGERLLAAYESDHGDEESYRAAKAEYEKRLPKDDPDDHLSYAYLLEMRGREYLRRAEAGFTRAFELGNAQALRQKIRLLHGQGRDEEGVEECRALLAERPEDVSAHVALAAALHLAGQNEAAWEIIHAAMEVFAGNGIVLNFAADIQNALGNHARAIALWRQAYALDPEDASALYGIACLHSDQGSSEEARAAWRDVIGWLEARGFDGCGETAWPREMLAKAEG